jgi:O-6-methylguanine DNA methyltransferase
MLKKIEINSNDSDFTHKNLKSQIKQNRLHHNERGYNLISVHLKKIDQITFAAGIEGDKVFATNFGTNEKRMLENLLESLPYNMPFQIAEEQNTFSEKLLTTLKAIYDGKDASPNFKIAMGHLSKYSQKVLKCVWQIPAGYLTSYGTVAKTCGGSPRAVGRVMATNPFAPLIPCHRVVQADFSIGGYGGGKETKLEFLKRENRGFKEPKEIMTESGVLLVHPVSKLLKKVGKKVD